MADAAVLLFDGFEELDAVGPYNVLGTAIQAGAGLDSLRYVTPRPADRVTASKGTTVFPDGTLDAADPPTYLIVPGGGWVGGDNVGARAAAEDETLLALIRECLDAGTTVAAVCTGGMILSRAGLLDGRAATTHASAIPDLEATDARVVNARVVDDGDVLTAGGVTAGIDLALWLVEREWGEGVADSVATTLEHEQSRDIYRGS